MRKISVREYNDALRLVAEWNVQGAIEMRVEMKKDARKSMPKEYKEFGPARDLDEVRQATLDYLGDCIWDELIPHVEAVCDEYYERGDLE